MHLAVGTASGISRLFDVRSHRPLAERDQRNGLPIRQIRFISSPHCGKPVCVSMDEKCVKFWVADSQAELITTVESEARINDIAFFPNSGLMLTAVERHFKFIVFQINLESSKACFVTNAVLSV